MNELPKGLTVPNQSTFALCTSLRSISLPKGLTSIGKWALYETEIIPLLKAQGLSATVYTQVSDVEDEVNGLVTYDRKVVKADAERMLRIAEKLKF